MVCNLQSRQKNITEIGMSNVQRSITPKGCNPELQFMCSTCTSGILVLNLCVKYNKNISQFLSLMKISQMFFELQVKFKH